MHLPIKMPIFPSIHWHPFVYSYISVETCTDLFVQLHFYQYDIWLQYLPNHSIHVSKRIENHAGKELKVYVIISKFESKSSWQGTLHSWRQCEPARHLHSSYQRTISEVRAAMGSWQHQMHWVLSKKDGPKAWMQSYAQRHTKNPRLSRALSHLGRYFGSWSSVQKDTEGLWPLPSLPSSLPPWTVRHGSPAESRLFWMGSSFNMFQPNSSKILLGFGLGTFASEKTDFQRGFVTGDEQIRPAGISARCQRCKNTFPQVPNPTWSTW